MIDGLVVDPVAIRSQRLSDTELSATIDEVYACVLEPHRWAGVLEMLCGRIDGCAAEPQRLWPGVARGGSSRGARHRSEMLGVLCRDLRAAQSTDRDGAAADGRGRDPHSLRVGRPRALSQEPLLQGMGVASGLGRLDGRRPDPHHQEPGYSSGGAVGGSRSLQRRRSRFREPARASPAPRHAHRAHVPRTRRPPQRPGGPGGAYPGVRLPVGRRGSHRLRQQPRRAGARPGRFRPRTRSGARAGRRRRPTPPERRAGLPRQAPSR